MKLLRGTIVLLAVAFLAANQAKATVYGDATGENFTGTGILDITSVEVTATGTDLIFKISLAGDPVATDWGKYMVGIDSTAGGDTSANGNGWGRPISMSAGMDYWLGSWVDSGNGAEVWKYTGSWGMQSATYASNPDLIGTTKDTSSVTIQLNYAGLGLAPGSSFNFDVYTSGGGGGDGAVDALADPNQSIADWGNPYVTTSPHSFTIPVPEPSTLVLVSLGGLALIGRLFRRRA